MNRIKVDFPKLSPNVGDCAYTYSFIAPYGLEHDSKMDTGLDDYMGVDARPVILEKAVKDFTIELRKKLYGDDVETMITSDLTELIKPEPFEKGRPRIKPLKVPSLLDVILRKLKF